MNSPVEALLLTELDKILERLLHYDDKNNINNGPPPTAAADFVVFGAAVFSDAKATGKWRVTAIGVDEATYSGEVDFSIQSIEIEGIDEKKSNIRVAVVYDGEGESKIVYSGLCFGNIVTVYRNVVNSESDGRTKQTCTVSNIVKLSIQSISETEAIFRVMWDRDSILSRENDGERSTVCFRDIRLTAELVPTTPP